MSGWAFWRRRFPDVRSSSGTWVVGDLAVCIADRWHRPRPENPKNGDVLRVAEVEDAEALGFVGRWLSFDGKAAHLAWDARDFRKAVRDDQPASADFRLPTRPIEQVPA